MMGRKIFKHIHLRLSLPAGIIITLMCLTGAILVFQEEILQLSYPERYFVKNYSGNPLPLDEIIERVDKHLDNDTLTVVQVFDDPQRTYIGTLASGQRSHVYINPYTSEVTGYYNYRSGFFHDVTRLHRWLMFKDMATGRIITGISTLFFVVILISGIVVWFPRKWKFQKSFFKIKWKKGGRRRIFDLHRVLGIYAALILLLSALTGLMWSFDWYRGGIAAIFGIEKQTENQKHSEGKDRDTDAETKQIKGWWQSALDASQNEIPDYQFIRIAQNGTITVLPKDAPHSRATDTYRYNPQDKVLESLSVYGDKKDKSYMMTWAYVLHVGGWGGIWTKILFFLAALAGASLPVTGYILWFKKRIKSRC